MLKGSLVTAHPIDSVECCSRLQQIGRRQPYRTTCIQTMD